MAARLVRAGDLVRVPWKNGGGTTAEIAAFPEGAGFERFGWRISMADVASDGPFSLFPGIDRTLIVVEGNGIELEVDGVRHRLNGSSPTRSFRGDARTTGRLLSGPIRDLNVMTRRGRFRHRVRAIGSGLLTLAADACAACILALDSPFQVTVGEDAYALQPLDALFPDPSTDSVHLSGSGRAILVEIAADESV